MICRETKKHAFTIPLWDHWASQLPPSPEVIAVAKVNGVEMEFWLRQVGAHLYFRPTFRGDQPELPRYEHSHFIPLAFLYPPTFGCFKPLPDYSLEQKNQFAASALASHFQRSIEAEEWGILSNIFAGQGDGCTLCLTSWRGNGAIRFWWDEGAGIPTEKPCDLPFHDPLDLLQWPDTLTPLPGVYYPQDPEKARAITFASFATWMFSEHGRELLNQKMASHQRQNQAPTWITGSAAEFAALTQWLCHSSNELWISKREEKLRSSPGKPYHAPLFNLSDASWNFKNPAAARVRFLGRLVTKWNASAAHQWSPSRNAENRPELLELAQGWTLRPSGQLPSPQILPAPSQHERLEAKLNLRDWLLTKMDASDVNALLQCEAGCIDEDFLTRLYYQYLT